MTTLQGQNNGAQKQGMKNPQDFSLAGQNKKLPDGWVETTLGEVAEKVYSGGTPSTKREDFYGGNIPWIRTQEVNFNYIKETDIKITKLGLENSSAKWIPENTVIIAMYGNSAGRVAYSKIKATTNQACCNFISDYEKSDPKFIYFNLLNRYSEIKGMANGAAQQNLNVGNLKQLKINLPPLPQQKAIAQMLSAFDDKIELLREQNETLEKIGETIFKEWFGKYKIGDDLPDGWRVGRLGDVIKIFDSQRVPLSSNERAKRKGIYPYYGATKIMDYVDDFLFDGTYLLMAEDGSVMTDDGYPFLQYVWGKMWVNNHTHVLQGKNGFSTELLYVMLKKRNIANIVNGAVQLKINQTNLKNLTIIIPNNDTLDVVNEKIKPLFEKIKNNSEQIQTLAKTRDTLLPKLMKGDILLTSNK